MAVLGGEFCDMSPQELAAPVNTVAVSSERREAESLTSTSAERLTWQLAAQTDMPLTACKQRPINPTVFTLFLFSDRKNGSCYQPS